METLTHSSFNARPNQPSKNTTAVTYTAGLALHSETSLDLCELLVSLEYIFLLLSSVSLHRSRVQLACMRVHSAVYSVGSMPAHITGLTQHTNVTKH